MLDQLGDGGAIRECRFADDVVHATEEDTNVAYRFTAA
jgi:hypothetical protein